jgi:hypothetical protein
MVDSYRYGGGFCQHAENDRKLVAVAITPLWVISEDNIGVTGFTWRAVNKKALSNPEGFPYFHFR